MAFTVQDDGRARIDGFSPGVLPVMYPEVYGDASSVFSFRPVPADPNSGFGMVLLSEDDSDGALDYYTVVWVLPADGSLGVAAFLDGEFQGLEFVAIPAEADFAPDDWNVLRVTVRDGGLVVTVNGVETHRWSHPAMAAEGQIGYTLLSAVEGDTMLVDAFVVTPEP
ncbi:MAG: hypothetical protein R3290_11700 [Acidimicrobiia bacterium]|nr:hypothetical protein [Acidimicrobiia bacterium]